MNDMHIKVFKLTKENISKKYHSPDQQLDFIPQFRLFMKQREPYNNYLYSSSQKPIVNYPATPSAAKCSNLNTASPNLSPQIQEPNPLTNAFFRQSETTLNKSRKEDDQDQYQYPFSSQFPASFNKQHEERQFYQSKDKSIITIHSRSLNSRQQQNSPSIMFRRQPSPKLNSSRNNHTVQNIIENQQNSNSPQPKQMLFIHSHPQIIKQSKILQINNCFKIQQTPLQNTLIQQKLEAQKQIRRSTPTQQDEQINYSFQEADQNSHSIKSQKNFPQIVNQGSPKNHAVENQFRKTNFLNNSNMQSNLKLTYESDYPQENSLHEFMSKRNLFIGNNICNKGRPQSSFLFHERRQNYNDNVNNASIQQNKFVIKGFQVKKQ